MGASMADFLNWKCRKRKTRICQKPRNIAEGSPPQDSVMEKPVVSATKRREMHGRKRVVHVVSVSPKKLLQHWVLKVFIVERQVRDIVWGIVQSSSSLVPWAGSQQGFCKFVASILCVPAKGWKHDKPFSGDIWKCGVFKGQVRYGFALQLQGPSVTRFGFINICLSTTTLERCPRTVEVSSKKTGCNLIFSLF